MSGGGCGRASEAARAGVLASEEGRRTVVLTLVSAVGHGYIQLCALDRQLEIARQTSQSLGEAARLQRVRFEGGAVPRAAIARPSLNTRPPPRKFGARAPRRAPGEFHQRAAGRQPRPDRARPTIDALLFPRCRRG